MTSQALNDRLVAEADLCLNAGSMYGPRAKASSAGTSPCPREKLREGLERFCRFMTTIR